MVIKFDVLSLIVGIIGMLVSTAAIFISLYIYRTSLLLNNSTKDILHRIDIASSKIETISTNTREDQREIIRPLIPYLINNTNEGVISKVEYMGSQLVNYFRQKSEDVQFDVDKKLLKDLSEMTRNQIEKLKGNLTNTSHVLESEYLKKPIPGSLSYDWGPFIKSIYRIEKSAEQGFVSVKWLREKNYADNTEFQTAIEFAIEKQILVKYSIPNPKKPVFPVSCVKLNKEHLIVINILSVFEKENL